jgi:hypothetical protein
MPHGGFSYHLTETVSVNGISRSALKIGGKHQGKEGRKEVWRKKTGRGRKETS